MSRASNKLPDAVAEEKKNTHPVDENGRRIISKMTDLAWDIFELKVCSPEMTQQQIAEALGSNQVYISRVINSPCFKDEMSKLRRERIADKLELAVDSGVDRMRRIMDDDEAGDADAINAFKAVATVAGMGGTGKGAGTQVNVNVGDLGVTGDMVKEAAARRKAKIVEGQFTEVKDE